MERRKTYGFTSRTSDQRNLGNGREKQTIVVEFFEFVLTNNRTKDK